MRVVWVALCGVVPLTLFVQWSDLRVGGTMAAGAFPPLGACLLWGILLGVQWLFARGQDKSGQDKKGIFTRAELLVILAVWLVANMVAGRGLLHPLLASLAGPTYYARSGLITSALANHVPNWLAITDKTAARQFFEGHGVPVPWHLWMRPLLTWALFFIPFLTANICLCALFEQVWVRHERLAFPLVALPLEGVKALGVRLPFLFGLAVPLLLHGFGVANAYLPGVPCISFFNDLSSLVANPPWTALRPLYLNFYPLLVGLTFLAPVDVTFGIWFFLLLNKMEVLLTAVMGWNDGAASGGTTAVFPYVEEQSAGAYLMLGAILVWNARKHLKRIITDSSEKSYRPLAWGFGLGVVGTLAWCVVTGLPLWFAVGFFGFYLVVALVLSRLMAEGGVSWTLAPILPDKLILSLVGSQALSPVAITRLMYHVQHLRDTRQLLAPAVFSAGKLRGETGFSVARFYGLLLGAVSLALVLGTLTALPLFYQHGALTIAPNSDGVMMSASVIPTTAVSQASSRLLLPIKPTPAAAGAIALGSGITWLLSLLRVRFLWWPLHPLGYALTGTLQIGYANKMLFSLFLGWAFKALTLRFGGAQGFRFLRGAALGLILGDLLMGSVLKLLDALDRKSVV